MKYFSVKASSKELLDSGENSFPFPCIYTTSNKTISLWNTHVFESVLLLSISKNSLQTPSLDDIFWDILHCQIQLFSGRPINNVKRSFEIFLTDHYAGDIENKNIAGKY